MGQRRNGLSKNTLLDNLFSARSLLRYFDAHPLFKEVRVFKGNHSKQTVCALQGDFSKLALNWERKKPINIKNFGGTPPGVRPVCPGDTSHLSRDMSRLARGHSVPLVLIYT